MKNRLYSRPTLRRIIKAHQPEKKLTKNVDIMIYLDYILFLQRLASEANIEASRASERSLEHRHIHSVLERVLQEFKG